MPLPEEAMREQQDARHTYVPFLTLTNDCLSPFTSNTTLSPSTTFSDTGKPAIVQTNGSQMGCNSEALLQLRLYSLGAAHLARYLVCAGYAAGCGGRAMSTCG